MICECSDDGPIAIWRMGFGIVDCAVPPGPWERERSEREKERKRWLIVCFTIVAALLIAWANVKYVFWGDCLGFFFLLMVLRCYWTLPCGDLAFFLTRSAPLCLNSGQFVCVCAYVFLSGLVSRVETTAFLMLSDEPRPEEGWPYFDSTLSLLVKI